MALRPHVVHVVGHTEAHHAAAAGDVIESCKLARRAIENALHGQPAMLADPIIQQRKQEILREAQVTLQAIRALAGPGVTDPLSDATTLARAVTFMPIGVGARCLTSSDAPTVRWPGSSSGSTALRPASSISAIMMGVASTLTPPLPK
jgi:hypothetical protein